MNLTARIGPAYSRAQVVEAGLDPDRLISFVVAGGGSVFPVAQFDVVAGGLEPRIDVADMWHALSSAPLGPLGRWMWMTGAKQALGGESPLGYMNRFGVDLPLKQLVWSMQAQALAA